MKLLLKIPLAVFLLTILIGFSACNEEAARDCFKTKQDSLAFAKAVFQAYPAEKNMPLTVTFAERTAATAPSEPVSWDIINRYKEKYDLSPILVKPDGTPYKGFILDTGSFSFFKGNNKCSQLYLRLGKKDNNEYTIMVLPMDNAGYLLQSAPVTSPGQQNLNHDHLDPCPTECPKDALGSWQ